MDLAGAGASVVFVDVEDTGVAVTAETPGVAATVGAALSATGFGACAAASAGASIRLSVKIEFLNIFINLTL